MISFYKIRVGYPEIRTVYHLLNKVVVWQHKYKTDIPPTENLPSTVCYRSDTLITGT